LLEDLNIAYNQALQVSVLDVIPLPNGLNQQVEYNLSAQVPQYRLERRVHFEECIKATCQPKFKAQRHFELKQYWETLINHDDKFPLFTQMDWMYRRSYFELQLFIFTEDNTPCMIDIAHISFTEACWACGFFM
jgi:hypothetical protein